MPKSNVLRVDEKRWRAAQEFELRFAQQSVNSELTAGLWWEAIFDRYEVLRERSLPNVIELGCGPHTNVRFMLPLIDFERLWLEDPLIHEYLNLRRERRVLRYWSFKRPVALVGVVRRYRATLLSETLEELSLPDESIDLCVCINVLDHVQDAVRCLKQLRRIMRNRGILVIGQDLSNEEDVRLCPESWKDVGHPIKVDEGILDSYLGDLTPLYRRILPREQGRNPRCHYGTYLLIGQHVAAP